MKQVVVDLLSQEIKLPGKEIGNLIEIPPNDTLGDYAFPCFFLAKIEKKSPLLIAENLVEKLRKKLPKEISGVEMTTGYVNFFVDKKVLAMNVLKSVDKIILGKKKTKKKVMIEFSQPNTHKAFHVGHIRGTSLGESLARIFEFSGRKVIRANYSGDTGMHIAKWIWCYTKYHKNESLSSDESWIAGIYVDAVQRLAKNEKLQREVEEINRKLDSKEDKELNELWKKTRKLSVDSWKKIYKELNTKFDVHYFESEVEQLGKKITKSLIKKGIAEVSDGAVIIDFEKKGFADLGIWVLLRSDGTVLYSAKDLVLAEKKMKDFNLDESIYVIGNEQELHMKQLFKVLKLDGFKMAGKLRHVSYGMVRLPTGKMSSRTGDNILYSDFMKEVVDFASKEISKRFKLVKKELNRRAVAVAIATIKYSMLKQGSNKNIIFDKKEALRFEGDTGLYLLYSYARASSIIKKVKSKKKIRVLDLNPKEVALLKKITSFEEIVSQAYGRLAPNLVANYCYELASLFNEFYHACPVIGSDEEGFRVRLVEKFREVLKEGLHLLGIETIEEM